MSVTWWRYFLTRSILTIMMEMKEKNKVDIYRVNNLFDPVWLLHFSHFLHFCHIHLSKIVKMRERIIMTLTTFCCLIPSSKVDVIYCFYAKEFHFFELRKHNFRVFCFSFFLSLKISSKPPCICMNFPFIDDDNEKEVKWRKKKIISLVQFKRAQKHV